MNARGYTMTSSFCLARSIQAVFHISAIEKSVFNLLQQSISKHTRPGAKLARQMATQTGRTTTTVTSSYHASKCTCSVSYYVTSFICLLTDLIILRIL